MDLDCWTAGNGRLAVAMTGGAGGLLGQFARYVAGADGSHRGRIEEAG